jgi:ATP synthase protein I
MFKKKQSFRAETKKIAVWSSLGLMLPSSIAVGLVIGYLLDKTLGTHPWLLIVFFFLGTASGILNLLRGLNRMQDDKKRYETNNDDEQ